MSIYPEIPCSKYKILDGVTYRVRKFGFDGVVYEEELIPIPDTKTTTVYNPDGTENTDLSTVEYIEQPEG